MFIRCLPIFFGRRGEGPLDAQLFSNSFEGGCEKIEGVPCFCVYCILMTKFFEVFWGDTSGASLSLPSPPRVHLCLIPYPHPPCLPVPTVMNLNYRFTICRCSVIIRWIFAVSWPCGPACQEASRNQTFLEEHRRSQGKVRHSRDRSPQAEHSCSQPKYFIKHFK